MKIEFDDEKDRANRQKHRISLAASAEVVEGIKATGRGYNARVEQVLRDALAQGKL